MAHKRQRESLELKASGDVPLSRLTKAGITEQMELIAAMFDLRDAFEECKSWKCPVLQALFDTDLIRSYTIRKDNLKVGMSLKNKRYAKTLKVVKDFDEADEAADGEEEDSTSEDGNSQRRPLRLKIPKVPRLQRRSAIHVDTKDGPVESKGVEEGLLVTKNGVDELQGFDFSPTSVECFPANS